MKIFKLGVFKVKKILLQFFKNGKAFYLCGCFILDKKMKTCIPIGYHQKWHL